jgi:hypothetical protein
MSDPFLVGDLTFFFRGTDLVHWGEFENGKLSGKKVAGVFDVKFFDEEVGSMRVAAENSQFLGMTEDLSGAAAGDLFIVEGKRYRVAACHDDLTGMSLLDLAEELDSEIGEDFA